MKNKTKETDAKKNGKQCKWIKKQRIKNTRKTKKKEKNKE